MATEEGGRGLFGMLLLHLEQLLLNRGEVGQ